MRDYLFRGKRKDNGEWVEGNLFVPDNPDKPTEILIGTNVIRISYEVIPSTVGQFTGLTAKNGKIFEGDIIKIKLHNRSYALAKVYFKNGVFTNSLCTYLGGMCNSVNRAEIIGNIHDNPELLKGGADNGST